MPLLDIGPLILRINLSLDVRRCRKPRFVSRWVKVVGSIHKGNLPLVTVWTDITLLYNCWSQNCDYHPKWVLALFGVHLFRGIHDIINECAVGTWVATLMHMRLWIWKYPTGMWVIWKCFYTNFRSLARSSVYRQWLMFKLKDQVLYWKGVWYNLE